MAELLEAPIAPATPRLVWPDRGSGPVSYTHLPRFALDGFTRNLARNHGLQNLGVGFIGGTAAKPGNNLERNKARIDAPVMLPDTR